MKEEVLRMERVTFEEEDGLLLSQFQLHIDKGEIMGLVCVDDRGKDALMRLLRFNLPVGHGRIFYHGQLVNAIGYRSRKPNRISIIRRRRSLIESMSVAENVFVIKGSYRKLLVNPRKLEKQFDRFVKKESLPLTARGWMPVIRLTAYEKAAAELCKSLMMGTRLVIICDIADYLSAIDLGRYFELLKKFAEEGHSFLYICDRYEEARRLCGRIAVMENGSVQKIMGQGEPPDRLFFPDAARFRACRREPEGKPLLEFRDVSWNHVKHMSFRVYPGEWITILDISNTVLEDLVSLMNMDAEAREYGGEIRFRGRELQTWQKDGAARAGIAFITENPARTMLFREMSYMDNLCFRLDERKGQRRIKRRIRKSVAQEYGRILGPEIQEMDITRLDRPACYRLVYYGIHLCNPNIVFCIRPLAGADIHMKKEVLKLLGELHGKGITVVELLSNVSDLHMPKERLIVLKEGGVYNLTRR